MTALPNAHSATRIAIAIGEGQRDGREIEQLLEGAGFDVDVVSLPDVIDAVERAIADQPDRPVIAVPEAGTARSDLRRALHAGASGIVVDAQFRTALVPTARAIVAGQLVVPPALGRRLSRRALSFREKQILALVVLGYTNRQIAGELFVAESTVKTHLSSAFHKLETRSRAETAALILDPEEGYGLGVLGLMESAGQTAA